jgi:hypothetical protein
MEHSSVALNFGPYGLLRVAAGKMSVASKRVGANARNIRSVPRFAPAVMMAFD